MSGLLRQLQKNGAASRRHATNVRVLRTSDEIEPAAAGESHVAQSEPAGSANTPWWVEKPADVAVPNNLLEDAAQWALEKTAWTLPKSGMRTEFAQYASVIRMSYRCRSAVELYLEKLVYGEGPLRPLYDDEAVEAIHVDGPHNVRVIRNGQAMQTPIEFSGPQGFTLYLHAALARGGAAYDRAKSAVSCVLDDAWSTRATVLSPEVAHSDTPRLCLDIVRSRRVVMYDLLRGHVLPPLLATWLAEVISTGEANILVAGPPRSGKSDMISGLLSCVGSDERLMIFEERRRLSAANRGVDFVCYGRAGKEGAPNAASLLETAVLRRPHRLAVDRVEAGFAASYLQIIESGLTGSIAGIRAADAPAALRRFCGFVGGSGIGTDISGGPRLAAAVNLVIGMRRYEGRPCLDALCEVSGYAEGQFTLKPLVSYEGLVNGARRWLLLAGTSHWMNRTAAGGVYLAEGPGLRTAAFKA